jgi:hypothetical protein
MAKIKDADRYLPAKLAAQFLREVADKVEKDTRYWHLIKIQDHTRTLDELRPAAHKIYGKETGDSYISELEKLAENGSAAELAAWLEGG